MFWGDFLVENSSSTIHGIDEWENSGGLIRVFQDSRK